MPISISIIVPVFVESSTAVTFFQQLFEYCQSHPERRFEILAIVDPCDTTVFDAITSITRGTPELRILRIDKKLGRSFCLKEAFFKAAGEICVFIDADGSVFPEEIEKGVAAITAENCDIFAGYRLKDPSGRLHPGLSRDFLSSLCRFLIRKVLSREIRDARCGFKVFRREALVPLFERIYLRHSGMDIEILFLAYKMGYKITEGPVIWRPKKAWTENLIVESFKILTTILMVRNWHCTPINFVEKHMGPNEYQYMYEMEQYHWWFVNHRNLAVRLVRLTGIHSPKMLDVGAGTGGKLLEFGKLGETSGVDISDKAVEFCRKRGLEHVFQAPAESMPFPEKSFDIILCLDVLEHVSQPVVVLKELKRLLKDDGRIILTVPAFKILWSQHDDALCHLRRYEKKALKLDIVDGGLKLEKIGYMFFASFFFVAPIRIMRRFIVRNNASHSDTTTLPPKFINESLKFLFLWETEISVRLGLPFGTTLYAVCSKS